MADFDPRQTLLAGQPQVRRTDQTTISAPNFAIFQSVATMKAYLTGLGAPKNYTAARLHAMTFNDLVYACKLELGIKS